MKAISDTYIIEHGANGCNISYMQIRELALQVSDCYKNSSPLFWMWKMFQLGFACGKREERKRKKNVNKC